MASLPKRTRVNDSSLVKGGELKYFESVAADFPRILTTEGQAYFDRTRYISVLETFNKPILFFRPRRFGKSLTISMLDHFHGLQYAREHQSFYKVCNDVLDYLAVRANFTFNHCRVLMSRKISQKEP